MSKTDGKQPNGSARAVSSKGLHALIQFFLVCFFYGALDNYNGPFWKLSLPCFPIPTNTVLKI